MMDVIIVDDEQAGRRTLRERSRKRLRGDLFALREPALETPGVGVEVRPASGGLPAEVHGKLSRG